VEIAMLKKTKPAVDPAIRRVAVLVDTSTDWGRRIITGVVSYVREHERWQLFIEPVGLEEQHLLPAGWNGDGVISRISTSKIANHLGTRNIPVVNISGVQIPGPQFPRVANDVRMVGKMAADYFLARGFKNFGYLSPLGFEPVAEQREAFANAVAAAGFGCAVYSVKTHHGAQNVDWNTNIHQLGDWLCSLPRPLAVLTWSGSREVIYAAQHAGLSVPEEVSVMSGSDDFLCEVSQVPISAVRAAGERIGYEAASQLDALMRGSGDPAFSIYIPPSDVITRQSTDTLAISDHSLIQALTFIRENSEKPIQVRETASRAGVSSRVLERRFKEVLGSTPAEHIRRSHLDRAKQLLSETDLAMPEVAEAAGFGSPAYMSFVFRKELETTPLRYRREARGTRRK
jgi:LacI family transcriptional regulator